MYMHVCFCTCGTQLNWNRPPWALGTKDRTGRMGSARSRVQDSQSSGGRLCRKARGGPNVARATRDAAPATHPAASATLSLAMKSRQRYTGGLGRIIYLNGPRKLVTPPPQRVGQGMCGMPQPPPSRADTPPVQEVGGPGRCFPTEPQGAEPSSEAGELGWLGCLSGDPPPPIGIQKAGTGPSRGKPGTRKEKLKKCPKLPIMQKGRFFPLCHFCIMSPPKGKIPSAPSKKILT